MSSFVRNNSKWHQQFTALKFVCPKTLCLLFKGKYCRWSAVSIKRPFLLQGMLTAPCSRGAGLIRETFCQSADLKMFLCYIYCLIERITLYHSTQLDADWSVLSKPSIFLLIFLQLQFSDFQLSFISLYCKFCLIIFLDFFQPFSDQNHGVPMLIFKDAQAPRWFEWWAGHLFNLYAHMKLSLFPVRCWKMDASSVPFFYSCSSQNMRLSLCCLHVSDIPLALPF